MLYSLTYSTSCFPFSGPSSRQFVPLCAFYNGIFSHVALPVTHTLKEGQMVLQNDTFTVCRLYVMLYYSMLKVLSQKTLQLFLFATTPEGP
jgi:hypothetical protein